MSNQHSPNDNAAHRIDPAHRLTSDISSLPVETPDAQLVAAAAGVSGELVDEQRQLQGHQLALELTKRQREIDRREAQFNAYLATLENESRTIRLRHSERDDKLSAQEKEYSARFAELAQREAAQHGEQQLQGLDSATDSGIHKKQLELDERLVRVEAEENRLRFQWQQIQSRREAAMQLVRHLMRSVERRRAALEGQQIQSSAPSSRPATDSELQKFAAELDERHQVLIAAQQEADADRSALQREREQLRLARTQWEDVCRREQSRQQQLRKSEHAEHQQRQEALERRGEELARRQASLDQMQATVTRTHRDALELRLATEQLWSQMSEKVSPAELAETLGHLRAKLSEHYRLQEAALGAKHEALQEMAARLEQQQQRIGADREQLRDWLDRRNEEIEYQAARLVAREQELETQQSKHEQARQQWDQQRHEYEDEIRRLRAQTRKDNLAAA